MCHKTRQQPINLTVGLAIAQFLPNNTRRKAFIFAPVVQGPASTANLVAVQFANGAAQSWTVPNGVTQVIDIYAWGSGGNSAAGQAVNGGGGGGGGAFGTSGPLTVTPGSVFSLAIDAKGTQAQSTVTTPGGVIVINAGSGQNAAASTGGAAGAATTGAIKQPGGVGQTAATAVGGGGGG